MENKKYYITTPIYYPSGKFHIGTAYCTTLTDCIKRYKKARGYDVYMLTGLDEHGQKIQTVAEKNGLTPQEHVDIMAKKAVDLWKLMDIQYNKFIRTTDDYHCKAVQKTTNNGNTGFSVFLPAIINNTVITVNINKLIGSDVKNTSLIIFSPLFFI